MSASLSECSKELRGVRSLLSNVMKATEIAQEWQTNVAIAVCDKKIYKQME
jgi:hypothetical protein